MKTYIALLRGVNVAGRNKLGMPELVKSCEALGFAEVRSYLQSGNLIFVAQGTAADVADALEARIAQDFGHAVQMLVLPAEELDHVLAANPLRGEEEKHGHATFLFRHVSETRFAELALPLVDGEKAKLIGRVVILYCPHGYAKTKLNTRYFEKQLGVPATTRNLRTVRALRDMSAPRQS